MIDTDGRVLDSNRTALEYIDSPFAAVDGEYFWETPWFSHSTDLQADVKGWVERAAAGEYVEFEADHVRPNGDRSVVKGVFRPVTGDDGAVVSVLVSTRDITDEKERKQELQLFRTLLDQSTDSVLVIDPETAQYLDVNRTAHERRGYTKREMLDATVMDIETELPDLAAWQSFVDKLKAETELMFDGTHRRKDGSTYPVEVNATYLELDRDYVVAIARDVTNQRAHQQELEWANTVLSTLLETLPIGVLAEDADREVLIANERLVDLFDIGESPDDLVGANCEQLAEQASGIVADSAGFLDRVNELISGHASVQDEEVVLADDRTFVRSYRSIALPDGAGHLWTYQDITERKTYEARLEALNERAQDVMAADTREEVAEIGVDAARDVLGLDANAIHLANDSQSALLPTAATDALYDLIGTPPVFTEGDGIAWRAYDHGEALAIDDVRTDSDVYNPDTPIRSELHLPLGEYGILIAGSPMRAAFDQQDLVLGEILAGSLVTALDQMTRTEQLRAREQELQRQNDRLEEFASVVSHDLRNPLNVAKGRVELAQSECASEHLDEVTRAHRRMTTLIEDLLALARDGQQVNAVEPISFQSVVQECWGNVATGDATLEVTDEATIHADSNRLRQLLENLLRNAVEHGGSEVTITAGATEDGFYIADDGPGIPADAREKIFETGYSTSETGTGFGLSIVKQIVDAHDWQIDVREAETGGARFEITDIKQPDTTDTSETETDEGGTTAK
ncbi:PAS domain-containing protein [Halobacterium sp. KA-6]|uniref:PAS domain-containing protein n=1 Tax=Halobacterium sp. KA-6 TaxID=2896368 RepID=UPI001E377330|nr:PAS domain-containing protein [Halobacterium sp. KA-6]MCD2204486.1 PAS domain-containing protein [Halobacterium sp. KA-6]